MEWHEVSGSFRHYRDWKLRNDMQDSPGVGTSQMERQSGDSAVEAELRYDIILATANSERNWTWAIGGRRKVASSSRERSSGQQRFAFRTTSPAH